MDGSLFDLPDNQSAKELTDQVIALIGSMTTVPKRSNSWKIINLKIC